MLYAEPRYTKDLDIVIGVDDDSLSAFASAIAEFGFPLDADQVSMLRVPDKMISLGRPPVRIDILNELPGVNFDDAWDQRNAVKVDGTVTNFISLQHLIASKRATRRPQDLIDLESLEPLLPAE
jgi:hypothetical protein